MDDGDSEDGFGADGVGCAECRAGGAVEEGADLVLPVCAAGPGRGTAVGAVGDGEGPGISALVAGSVECFDAGDVFGGLLYGVGPFVIGDRGVAR
ncbi:hypothetical protein CVN56_26250 [Rhodococcus sp. AQ5-07]|nr:hypothetical protein CVN56_26250 [Rhodococcus sp. AQ5-07]